VSRPKSTRREFNKSLALAAAAPLAVCAAAAADQPAGQPPPAEALAGTAQALTEVVRLRYGKHVTDVQLKRVRQQIERGLRGRNALRRPPLRNADEPDFVFFAEVF
jgi:hypothetical protein